MLVFNKIQEWEVKVAQLAQLANKYHSHLECQQQHYNQLKIVLDEKDQLINYLNSQLNATANAYHDDCHRFKESFEYANQHLKEGLMQTISLQEQVIK